LEEKSQQQLRDAFTKLHVTLSIIPGGCTGYVQVLDVLINKLIKQYIEEYEDLWVEQNFELWQSGKWSIGDRRVLMTHWVAQAFERVHMEHKDAIPCVTEYPSLVRFLFRTFAKEFYKIARIQMNT
jgi:hypothetical protein